jgi:hypothetical protein
MASHFNFYSADSEVVIPFNARYSFPSQANKCQKTTPRIPPKNGDVFNPGSVTRLEFPAQGYINATNTTLTFDVTLQSFGGSESDICRIQNNVQSLISRITFKYGSTPLEDIIDYNDLVRGLTEWTSTNQTGSMDQTAIAEGIGGVCIGGLNLSTQGLVNVRQMFIQGSDWTINTGSTPDGVKNVPNTLSNLSTTSGVKYSTRRYQVNLALGLLTQDKLIPTKFMASQLAIEIAWESAANCLFAVTQLGSTAPGSAPTYTVSNINLIPEVLDFDASYDSMFLKGLQDGGVPIKFSSWHTFISNISGQSTCNVQIQERSRSVKALFAIQKRGVGNFYYDSGATFFDTAEVGSNPDGSTMQNYQFRIGARYFPAQPVQTSTSVGSKVTNGGAESFLELQKALNTVGDSRLSTSCNPLRWAVPRCVTAITLGGDPSTDLGELDYSTDIAGYDNNGRPKRLRRIIVDDDTGTVYSGSEGSSCYVSAIDLETSNGLEISGLNAEEQSDISFLAYWSAPQAANMQLKVYSYFDAMLILRENNVIELIQ